MMMKPIKRALVIHDLCGIGKAALSNIMPILSVMGIEPCAVPTMILSSHTGGFGNPVIRPNNHYIQDSIEHYKKVGIEFQGILVGYLGNIENIKEVQSYLGSTSNIGKIIIDPIFADNGKIYSNFDLNYVENMRGLLKYGYIITPNLTEACYLANVPYKENLNEDQVKDIAKILGTLGSKKVIITSIVKDNLIGTGFYDNTTDAFKIYYVEKQEKSYPGTGDIFAAVLMGNVLKENDTYDALKYATNFTLECIKESSKYDYDTKEGVLLEDNLYKLIY